jgi:hypothetical protein
MDNNAHFLCCNNYFILLNLNGGKIPCNPSFGSCNIFLAKEKLFKKSPFEHEFFRKTPFGEPMLEKIISCTNQLTRKWGKNNALYVVLPKTHFSLEKQQVLCGFAQNTIFLQKNNGFFVVLPETQFSLKNNRFFSLWFCPKHNYH